jgi:hypothetical protein
MRNRNRYGRMLAISVSMTGSARHRHLQSSPGLFRAPVARLVIGGFFHSKNFPSSAA